MAGFGQLHFGMWRSQARFSQKAQSSLSQFGGVHGGRGGVTKQWRNKPLLRRDGDVRFKTGTEAAELLLGEASRRDVHLTNFLQTFGNTLNALTPVFDRNPKVGKAAGPVTAFADHSRRITLNPTLSPLSSRSFPSLPVPSLASTPGSRSSSSNRSDFSSSGSHGWMMRARCA